MKLQPPDLISRIRTIIAEQILPGQRPEEVADPTVANLDSIGRLTLLVVLENELGVELMGPDIGPEVFQTMAALSGFIIEKAAGQESAQ